MSYPRQTASFRLVRGELLASALPHPASLREAGLSTAAPIFFVGLPPIPARTKLNGYIKFRNLLWNGRTLIYDTLRPSGVAA
jgi:hypothetical protein